MSYDSGILKPLVWCFILSLGIIPLHAQSIELADFLKDYAIYPPKSYRILLNGKYEIITREDNWISSPQSQGFILGNRDELDEPIKLIEYLETNGFEVDEAKLTPDEYGNIYAYLKYNDLKWLVEFSCGSHGCGATFVLNPKTENEQDEN